MAEDIYFQKVMTTIILVALIVLSYFLLKPILLSIILGVLLAFIFTPVYKFLFKYIKIKDLSAILICVLLVTILVLPLWFLTPIAVEESFKIYVASQNVDFVTPLKALFPSLFASEQFSSEVGGILSSFVSRSINSLINYFSNFILDFPSLMLQFLVVLFTFYFVLRDQEFILDYVRSLLPFSKTVQDKLFDYSKGITFSVLYGQFVVGVIQGVILGIGLFIFGVPNAVILTLLSIVAGIFPIIGTALIWIPVMIYLFVAGNSVAACGILGFGIISSSVDNLLRPLIIAKRTHISSSIIMIGMVGGFFLFGVLGFILGPLILSYLLVVLEIYRNKKIPGLLIQEEMKKA